MNAGFDLCRRQLFFLFFEVQLMTQLCSKLAKAFIQGLSIGTSYRRLKLFLLVISLLLVFRPTSRLDIALVSSDSNPCVPAALLF